MEDLNEKSQVSGVEELKNLFNHLVTEDELKQRLESAREKLTEDVKSNPLAAVGIAAAVGFLLGAILKR